MVDQAYLETCLRFYREHYACCGRILKPGEKKFLGDKNSRICRFCGKTCPQVTFRKNAHALPESVGNKSLFTYYECDSCNQMFGDGIENDFGNWSKPFRTSNRIDGKGGVPTIKSADGGRLEGTPHSLDLKHKAGDAWFVHDEENQQLTLKLARDSYTPVAVLKAFVRMGLTVLPELEMPNFQTAIAWIQDKDHSKGHLVGSMMNQTTIEGNPPSGVIELMIFRRLRDEMDVPYASFFLGFGNETYQVFLPSPERDGHLHGREIDLVGFCGAFERSRRDAAVHREPLDLTGTSIIKNDVKSITMRYVERTLITPESTESE